MKKIYLHQMGFTLIELLIVISILGTLAAVVLVAINPLEQLRKGRDSSRITGTYQLGNALIHYATAQGISSYPPGGAGWQTNILTSSSEMVLPIVAPNPIIACGIAANQDSGYCYAPINGSVDFAVWVILESGTEKNKLSSCSPSPKVAAAVYISSKGKVQLDCLSTAATVPTSSDTFVNP